MTFIRVVSPYMLHDAGVNEEVLDLWEPLRYAAEYFINYRVGQHQECLIDQAQDMLAKYASMIESKLETKQLCTVQLHTCVFHLPEMVRMYGPGVFRLELWVERVMQELKRITKYRTMSTPERIATAAWLLTRALIAAAAADPNVLDIWKKVDPDVSRNPQPQDTIDQHGNVLTSGFQDHNTDDSELVRLCSHMRHTYLPALTHGTI